VVAVCHERERDDCMPQLQTGLSCHLRDVAATCPSPYLFLRAVYLVVAAVAASGERDHAHFENDSRLEGYFALERGAAELHRWAAQSRFLQIVLSHGRTLLCDLNTASHYAVATTSLQNS